MTEPSTRSVDEILMGGGGPPAAKFDTPGATVGGRIVTRPQAYQEREYDPNRPGGGDPKFFPSGDPIMGINVDVQTSFRQDPDDDGVRRLYIQGKRLKNAVRDAVKAADAKGLEVGGELTVTFTHREDPEDKRSAKYYDVTYVPAATVAFMKDDPTPEQPTGVDPWRAQTPANNPAAYAQPTPAQAAPAAAGGVDPAAVQAAMANLPPEVLAAIQAAQK